MTKPILYSTPTCGPCANIKRFFEENKIEYDLRGLEDMINDGIRQSPYLIYKDWPVVTKFDISILIKMKGDINGTV